jgi:hypothetical protein
MNGTSRWWFTALSFPIQLSVGILLHLKIGYKFTKKKAKEALSPPFLHYFNIEGSNRKGVKPKKL